MLKLAGSIDLDQLRAAMDGGDKEASTLWEIGKRTRTDDSRRGMKAAVTLLSILGAALNKEKAKMIK